MKLSIVSYLDTTSSAEVRSLQQKLSEVTGSKASLLSWEPHVTVGDGVEVDESEIERLKNAISDIAASTNTFQLNLREINTLDNWSGGDGEAVTPYVIYLDVQVNSELLRVVDEVSRATNSFVKWYHMPQPYLPHCTLAFRDLTEEGFKLGIEYLKNQDIGLTTTINHVALVEKLPDLDRELVRFNFSHNE